MTRPDSGLLKILVFGGALLIAIPSLSLEARADAPARTLVQQTVLYPIADYRTTGWVTTAGNGSYWTELLSDDANTTYIYSTGTYSFYSPTMATFIDPGYANQTFEVTVWVIERHNPAPLTTQVGIRSTAASLYTGAFIMRAGGTPFLTNVWKNLTVTATRCPGTNTNWTVAQINAYHPVVDATGVTTVTQFGMLINVTIPANVTVSAPSPQLLPVVCLGVISASGMVIVYWGRESDD